MNSGPDIRTSNTLQTFGQAILLTVHVQHIEYILMKHISFISFCDDSDEQSYTYKRLNDTH